MSTPRSRPSGWALLSDLVLPVRCIGCDEPAEALCHRCRPDPDDLLRVPGTGTPVCAAGSYDGALGAALVQYKERDRRDLARPLGFLLARAVAAVLDGAPRPEPGGQRVALVPVPSTGAAVRRRGGDPLARLASVAAARAGVRCSRGALRPTRELRDSAGLGARERADNLAGAFVAVDCPPRFAAVVVDDIVTTGATLREVHRALQSAGWPVLGAAVVAATPHRWPSPAASPGSSIGSTHGAGLASGRPEPTRHR